MTTINISSFTSEAASKTKGILFRDILEPLIKNNEDITVDFEGITRFASPFFNNSFASLGIVYGFNTIKRIELKNISETGKITYDTSLENAKLISESPQFKEEIDEIINNTPKKVN